MLHGTRKEGWSVLMGDEAVNGVLTRGNAQLCQLHIFAVWYN